MTAKKIVLATLSAVLVAGAALPAFAAPGRDGPGRHGAGRAAMQDVMFVRLLKNADGNKDGKISREELSARQDALFTEIDANKDGTVTRGELMDFRQARLDEFRKNNPQPEQAENSDGDRHHRDRESADRRGWDHRDRDRHDARWDGQRHGGMMGRGLFRMVDEDRDGKITKAEVTTAGDQLFTRMDVNKDGTISIDDVPDRPL
jgi:hypothetical protein